ncbi:hypothetical protein evm_009520 [Chilo suppressalis]|nr:hypothetical protein evm_009520 [Chilo suppressalis]
MPNCAVVNCKNTSKVVCRVRGDVSYHRFPRDSNTKIVKTTSSEEEINQPSRTLEKPSLLNSPKKTKLNKIIKNQKLKIKSLPHPNAVQKWYQSIDGEPGFTTEALEALRLIVNKANGLVYCCLMIDEIAIKRKIEWDGKVFHGYVDFGGCLDNDQICEAKEALVFLVTGVNANWKMVQLDNKKLIWFFNA